MFILTVLFGYRFLYAQDGCFECHGDPDLTARYAAGSEVSLYVDSTKFVASVHGDLECVDCHEDAADLPHAKVLQTVESIRSSLLAKQRSIWV